MKVNKKFQALALTASLIAGYEGYSNVGYRDPTGLDTICWGSTIGLDGKPIKSGQKYSDAECESLFWKDILAHKAIVEKFTKVTLTEPQKVSITSFVYNIGEGNYRTSTFLRRINNGEDVGKVCLQEFPKWNKSKGIILPGLIRRRADEAKICNMESLDDK